VSQTAQERVEDALRTGEPVRFAQDEDRDIPARWLGDLLAGRISPTVRHAKGLTIEGGHITGRADWSHDHFTLRFGLVDCIFDEAMTASGLQVDGDGDLERSTLPALDLSYARLDGRLTLEGLRLTGLVPSGQGGEPKPALNLKSIKLAGELEIGAAEVQGGTTLIDAEIGGELSCKAAKLRNAEGIALSADGAKISGDLLLTDNFESWGAVRLLGGEIGGGLVCNGAKLHNPDGIAPSADGATISGDVLLTDNFEAWGTVGLPGVKIGGGLFFNGAMLHKPHGIALSATLEEQMQVLMIEPVPYEKVRGVGFYRQFLSTRDWGAFMRSGRLDARRALAKADGSSRARR
jgi:hypothetical protein